MSVVSTITKKEKLILFTGFVIITIVMLLSIVGVAFAEDTYGIGDILEPIIDVITTIFQGVGVVLSVYGVAQLILAFKNEDADSKSRASTLMIVGVVLLVLPSIISELDLVSYIGS